MFSQGPAVVVVSCVEDIEAVKGTMSYRTHPHNLVGKHCLKGVCRMDVSPDMTAVFPNLGVQCVRRRDVADSLSKRQEIKVDPFKQGFQHKTSTTVANLNRVRLCFQVFLNSKQPGQPMTVVPPVVSNIVRDRKAAGELNILNFSENWAPVEGGKKVLIFTEKVSRDDIEVHFGFDNGK